MRKQIHYFLIAVLISTASCWPQKNWRVVYNNSISSTTAIKTNAADSVIDNLPMLQPYRTEMNKTMNINIGKVDVALQKDKPNGTLGNMVCDAMLLKAKSVDSNCQIAISNYGGLRIPSITAGEISLGKIYELMPFENTISIIALSGSYVDTFCQKIAKSGGMPISGLSFRLQNAKAIDITVNAKPIDYQKIYYTCVNSYMASGGDECEFLIPLSKNNTPFLIRDAIIDFIKIKNAAQQSLVQEPIKRIL
jgi:2',3'-cyclic-nucleotide 2'-phosphodiesterase (5'-nucleotidase family)